MSCCTRTSIRVCHLQARGKTSQVLGLALRVEAGHLRVVDLVAKHGLLAMYDLQEFVDTGASWPTVGHAEPGRITVPATVC